MEKAHQIVLIEALYGKLVKHYELLPEGTYTLIKDTVVKAWNSGRVEALMETLVREPQATELAQQKGE